MHGTKEQVGNLNGYSPKDSTGFGLEKPTIGNEWKGQWHAFPGASNNYFIAAKTKGKMLKADETLTISNELYVSNAPVLVLAVQEKDFTVGKGSSAIQINGTTDKFQKDLPRTNEKPAVYITVFGAIIIIGFVVGLIMRKKNGRKRH